MKNLELLLKVGFWFIVSNFLSLVIAITLFVISGQITDLIALNKEAIDQLDYTRAAANAIKFDVSDMKSSISSIEYNTSYKSIYPPGYIPR